MNYARMNFFDDGAGRVYACTGDHARSEKCECSIHFTAERVSEMRNALLRQQSEVHLSQRHMVAVDKSNRFRPMATCPTGVKVQLLNPGFVAVYGSVTESTRDTFKGWAPLPSVPDELRG